MTTNFTKCIVAIFAFYTAISFLGCQSEVAKEKPDRNLPGLGIQRGLISKTAEATPGYVLFNPLLSDTTYLIDMDGLVVKTWASEYGPSGWNYLKDNGNFVRGGRDPHTPVFDGGGQGGWIEEFTWDGELVWKYKFSSEDHLLHHDVAIMPNGNYLAIAWESKTPEEATTAGLNPEKMPKAGVWPVWIVELKPEGKDGAIIVWEWHLWDHLIQDFNASAENYGTISQHPELLNINLAHFPDPVTKEELDEKRSRDNASTNDSPDNQGSDMFHFNAIHYNPDLDQIVLSSPSLDEIIIIDHSTTIEEAAGHEGGRWGKGGDFLYRWGNPENYDRGDSTDRKLGGQHDVKWIESGLPGEGNLMVFNNQVPYGKGGYSSVLELETPSNENGYMLNDRETFGPDSPKWAYIANDTLSFYSPFISGAHRMSNGNTFVTEGARGRFFEVNANGDVLWNYLTPYAGSKRMPDGTAPQPIGPFRYATFRATHIGIDHPAVIGKSFEPMNPQPAIYKPEKK